MQLHRAPCSLVMPVGGLQELMSAQKDLEQPAVRWGTWFPTGTRCWLQAFPQVMSEVLRAAEEAR